MVFAFLRIAHKFGLLKTAFATFGLAAAVSSASLVVTPQLPDGNGRDHFEGRVLLEAVDGAGEMKLIEDFAYVDPSAKRWLTPAETLTDGASIPALLHPVIGPPFRGPYLKAAIVHDGACLSRRDTWQNSHRMFYYALRRCGVSESKAKVMFAAVYHFGPRWPLPDGSSPYQDNIVAQKLASTHGAPATLHYDRTQRKLASSVISDEELEITSSELFHACRAWIERDDPSLSEIETWTAGMAG